MCRDHRVRSGGAAMNQCVVSGMTGPASKNRLVAACPRSRAGAIWARRRLAGGRRQLQLPTRGRQTRSGPSAALRLTAAAPARAPLPRSRPTRRSVRRHLRSPSNPRASCRARGPGRASARGPHEVAGAEVRARSPCELHGCHFAGANEIGFGFGFGFGFGLGS